MSRLAVIVAAVLGLVPARLTLVEPASVWGGESPQNDSNFTLEGKITRKEEGKLTVSGEQNIVFHVRYDDKTEIRLKDGGHGSSGDLKVGSQVHVEGDLSESGEITARTIRLLESP